MTNRDSDNKYKADTARQEKLDTSTQHYASTDVDGIEEKKLLRKIDWRLLPILGALYSISLVSHPQKALPNLHSRIADRPYQHRKCSRCRYGH
jgi:hypothetical protein